jgi:hypothetical protein
MLDIICSIVRPEAMRIGDARASNATSVPVVAPESSYNRHFHFTADHRSTDPKNA